MKKTIAIFLIVLYSCFISATLWAGPVFDSFVYERSLESNSSEKSETESSKETEAPAFVRIHKNLPGKIKIPRVQLISLNFKKFIPCTITGEQPFYSLPHLFGYNLPLFLKHGVLRI